MHGLAHDIVAPETEREIADAAARLGQRQVVLDPLNGADEINTVGRVLGQACAYGKDIDIKNNILRRESYIGQQAISPLGDGRLTLEGSSLALFVKGHYDGRSAEAP